MNEEKIAKYLSIILGPEVWFPVLILLFILKTGLIANQVLILLPNLIFFQLLLPAGILYWLIKTKRVSDWDIRKRQERFIILPIFLISTLVALVLVYHFGTALFFHLYLIMWLAACLGILITYFWKISLHAILNTTGTIIVNFLFAWQLPYLYLLIPVVAWARYHNKHHTIPQILAGVLVTLVIVLGTLKLFSYY